MVSMVTPFWKSFLERTGSDKAEEARMPKKTNRPFVVDYGTPNDVNGDLRALGGSETDHWNNMLAVQAMKSAWTAQACTDELRTQHIAIVAALAGAAPRNELEGMAAAQLIAAHNAAMECYRRAMLPEQTFEGRRENLTQANKLTRSWATLLGALDKHRGKGQQKVTVEHVHVHSGGQAIVGAVEQTQTSKEGAPHQSEEQPHARPLSNAPEPEMRGEDPARSPLPRTSDGEW